ncbi:4-galactosyl-N-acetylglucosaminide 3-alpha-L-fucosyltransferase 9-like [Paramormyrops kingsleyae]|uniref:4-galactosyl-N-acetylglucosaminide 3-alpha-L-fucosyltransferase 9-like n=1 Tax=Paramormyrops kingsleyae TaxID=1676925 RepID=UPI003B9775E4
MKFRRVHILFLVFLLIFVCFNVYDLCNSFNQRSNKFTAPPPLANNNYIKLLSNKFITPPPLAIKDNSKQTIVLVWTQIFGQHYEFESCAALFNITNCLITTDRNMYSKTHGLVIHHRDIRNDLSNLPSMVRPPFQKWVWMNFESPSNSQRIPGINNLFNLTMNYRLDANISIHGTLIPKQEDDLYVIPKKSLLVCWIVSNWNPADERVKFYNLLKEHINITVFGRVTKYLTNQEYVSTVSSCKFYLSFENSKHKDYITEKLYKPLDLGTVPVVLGPPREQYENIVPGDAFIHVEDFLSPKELANYLHFLDENETEYHRYFECKRHFKVKYVNFPIEHACRACDYLKKHSDEYSSFDNLNQWYWG